MVVRDYTGIGWEAEDKKRAPTPRTARPAALHDFAHIEEALVRGEFDFPALPSGSHRLDTSASNEDEAAGRVLEIMKLVP